MGFFRSMFRLFASVFGLAQGHTERATDRLVSGSPESIRAQFRKAREDLSGDYNEMRDAVSELIKIKEGKVQELRKLEASRETLAEKKLGAVELYKQTQDEKYRSMYANFAATEETTEERITQLQAELVTQTKTIERYKEQLTALQGQIQGLQKEESETVADIVSTAKVRQINDKLSGLATDTHSKNLEAIREARQRAKTIAVLSDELSGNDQRDLEALALQAGRGTKHMDAFDQLVGGGVIKISPEKPAQLSEPKESEPIAVSDKFTKTVN